MGQQGSYILAPRWRLCRLQRKSCLPATGTLSAVTKSWSMLTPSDAWPAMLRPAEWWNGEHTYSGSAANMTIEPRRRRLFLRDDPRQ